MVVQFGDVAPIVLSPFCNPINLFLVSFIKEPVVANGLEALITLTSTKPVVSYNTASTEFTPSEAFVEYHVVAFSYWTMNFLFGEKPSVQ